MFNLGYIYNSITRKKTVKEDVLATPLERCLTLFDLTLFGIGHVVGSGIYVVIGEVTKNIAGPAVSLSFLLSGIAAMLSGLCYGEFGAIYPKAGSSYSYVYVVMGELWAFIVAWNMLLESILAIALLAKAASGIVDSLSNQTISHHIIENVGALNVAWMAGYPDFLAMSFVFIATAMVCTNVKIYGIFNNIFTCLNLGILLLVIGACLYYGDISNWKNVSHGGFLPYGIWGVVAGASSSYLSYIGFESIAASGEEAINPSKDIPLAIIISISIVALFYTCVSASFSLLVPFYEVSVLSPFTSAFIAHSTKWTTILVSIGSFLALATTIVGVLYSSSRMLYSLSIDGLFFKFFSTINNITTTPIYSILLIGSISAIISTFVATAFLIEIVSAGVMIAFILLSVSLILLRYQTADVCPFPLKEATPHNNEETAPRNHYERSQKLEDIGKMKKHFKRLPVLRSIPEQHIPTISVASIIVTCIAIVLFLKHVALSSWWSITIVVVLILLFIASLLLLCTLENNISFSTFQAPFFPLGPVASLCINLTLICNLNWVTWIRVAVSIFVASLFYFGYGIRNSKEREGLLDEIPLQKYTEENKDIHQEENNTTDSEEYLSF